MDTTRWHSVFLLTLFVCPAVCRAYARLHPVGADVPARWASESIPLVLYTSELPAGVAKKDVVLAARLAAEQWSRESVSCTAMRVVIAETGNSAYASRPQPDGTNSIRFLSRHWCHQGIQRVGRCHDPNRAAITTHYYAPKKSDEAERLIVEVDIELNAVDFSWSEGVGTKDASPMPLDVGTVLLHEFGHAVGFGHPCEHNPVDSLTGRTVSCNALDKKLRQSVMMPGHVRTNWVSKHQLSADDARGLCETYPASAKRAGDSPGGPNNAAQGWAALLLGATALLLVGTRAWAWRRR